MNSKECKAYRHAIDAHADGELELDCHKSGVWYRINPETHPSFHEWPSECWRRRPKKVLFPWTSAQAIGKIVVRKDDGVTSYVVAFAHTAHCCLGTSTSSVLYARLLENFTQPDGSPCGVEE